MSGLWTPGWDEPVEEDMPRCPICGEETETLYRDACLGTIIGCDNCIEVVNAYDWEQGVKDS